MNKNYNFSPGPSTLSKNIIFQVKKELTNWKNLYSSVMEISHRNKKFVKLTKQSIKDLYELLKIPKNYKIIFSHGGARGQFSAIPLNFLNNKKYADYISSGYWTKYAIKESYKYCIPNIIDVIYKDKNNFITVKSMKEWKLYNKSAYIHYCLNETVEGISINEIPNFSNKITIADCSSCILSKPIDISKFDVLYASAQKNIGISGITLIIFNENLLKIKSNKFTPSILDYNILFKHKSMFNTPSTFSWYIASLTFKWLKKMVD